MSSHIPLTSSWTLKKEPVILPSGVPFNIDLLSISEFDQTRMRAVTSLDTFTGASKDFHPDGLFSTQTFGVAGSDARFARYGYINIKLSIIHPTVFKALIGLKALYRDILAGKEFAIWDPWVKDFVKSDLVDGKTGYQFFMEHWEEIVFEPRPSIKREQAIRLITKYKGRSLVDKILVIPAGLRDLEIDENGRESSDEINALYYKLVAISNTINPATMKVSPEAYNSQRMSLQNTFLAIYDYIASIVQGKKNLLMGKWASRKIFNGTRNVITSMSTAVAELDAPGNIGFNDTAVGLYQSLKAMLPISLYNLKNGFLAEVFTAVASPALLVNPKTLQSERVQLKPEQYDAWMTNEGLEKFITYFKEDSIRHDPIKVGGYYLGLMYRGPDKAFKLIHGIDELPPGRSADDCKPITRAELLYCAIYAVANNYPGFVTRFPIAGIGSVYPSMLYLKSTIKSEVRQELDNDWQPKGKDFIAYEFPTTASFFNSMAMHPSRLKGAAADHDGDTASWNMAYSDESVAEVKKFMLSKACYVNTDGSLIADISLDTVSFVLKNITGR